MTSACIPLMFGPFGPASMDDAAIRLAAAPCCSPSKFCVVGETAGDANLEGELIALTKDDWAYPSTNAKRFETMRLVRRVSVSMRLR